MTKENDVTGTLTLKWGTIKCWADLSEDAVEALEKFVDLGVSYSAMKQRLTAEHKDALCELIDAVDEPIYNDWSGEEMTREEAKSYVMGYGVKESA